MRNPVLSCLPGCPRDSPDTQPLALALGGPSEVEGPIAEDTIYSRLLSWNRPEVPNPEVPCHLPKEGSNQLSCPSLMSMKHIIYEHGTIILKHAAVPSLLW